MKSKVVVVVVVVVKVGLHIKTPQIELEIKVVKGLHIKRENSQRKKCLSNILSSPNFFLKEKKIKMGFLKKIKFNKI